MLLYLLYLTAKNYHLPPKHNISGVFSRQFMEKRKDKLQRYMDGVIGCLTSCDEMVVFLSPDGLGSISPTLGQNMSNAGLNTTITMRNPTEIEYCIHRCNTIPLLPLVSTPSSTTNSIFSVIASGLDTVDRATFIGSSAPVLMSNSQFDALNVNDTTSTVSPPGSLNTHNHSYMSEHMESSATSTGHTNGHSNTITSGSTNGY